MRQPCFVWLPPAERGPGSFLTAPWLALCRAASTPATWRRTAPAPSPGLTQGCRLVCLQPRRDPASCGPRSDTRAETRTVPGLPPVVRLLASHCTRPATPAQPRDCHVPAPTAPTSSFDACRVSLAQLFQPAPRSTWHGPAACSRTLRSRPGAPGYSHGSSPASAGAIHRSLASPGRAGFYLRGRRPPPWRAWSARLEQRTRPPLLPACSHRRRRQAVGRGAAPRSRATHSSR